ncbi:MAG TPA: hypothetical protein VHO27_09850, partial [Angustibacter sp.]|nr:hypothetical protein [Angustibacter sp.]
VVRGVWVPMMFFIGIVFAVVWGFVLVAGGRADAVTAQRLAAARRDADHVQEVTLRLSRAAPLDTRMQPSTGGRSPSELEAAEVLEGSVRFTRGVPLDKRSVAH